MFKVFAITCTLLPAVLAFIAIDSDIKDKLIAAIAIFSGLISYAEGQTGFSQEAGMHEDWASKFLDLAQNCGYSWPGQKFKGFDSAGESINDSLPVLDALGAEKKLHYMITDSPGLTEQEKNEGLAIARQMQQPSEP